MRSPETRSKNKSTRERVTQGINMDVGSYSWAVDKVNQLNCYWPSTGMAQ